MAEKVSTIVVKVDLGCSRCRDKIKKILCKYRDKYQIKEEKFDEKENTVTISGTFNPKELTRKLSCKAGNCIQCVKIVEPPKPKPKPDPKSEPKQEPKPDPKPEPKPDPKPQTPTPPPYAFYPINVVVVDVDNKAAKTDIGVPFFDEWGRLLAPPPCRCVCGKSPCSDGCGKSQPQRCDCGKSSCSDGCAKPPPPSCGCGKSSCFDGCGIPPPPPYGCGKSPCFDWCGIPPPHPCHCGCGRSPYIFGGYGRPSYSSTCTYTDTYSSDPSLCIIM